MPQSRPKISLDKTSFNLLVSNFAIGLFKNDPSLRPLSAEIAALGYRIFCVESSFSLPQGTMQPELVACSSNTCHTILGEWTTTPYVDNKRAQLLRYLSLTEGDLKNSIAVPTQCAKNSTVWLVIPKECLSSFQELLLEPDFSNSVEKVLLITFFREQEAGYKLEVHTPLSNELQIHSLLASGSQFKRLPRGYMRVVLSDLSVGTIFEPTMTAFTSLVVENTSEVSCESICKKMFDVWLHFDVPTKALLIRSVDSVFKEFVTRAYGRRVIADQRQLELSPTTIRIAPFLG